MLIGNWQTIWHFNKQIVCIWLHPLLAYKDYFSEKKKQKILCNHNSQMFCYMNKQIRRRYLGCDPLDNWRWKVGFWSLWSAGSRNPRWNNWRNNSKRRRFVGNIFLFLNANNLLENFFFSFFWIRETSS